MGDHRVGDSKVKKGQTYQSKDSELLEAAKSASRQFKLSRESDREGKSPTFTLLQPSSDFHRTILENNGFVFIEGKDPAGEVYSGYLVKAEQPSFQKWFPLSSPQGIKDIYASSSPAKAPAVPRKPSQGLGTYGHFLAKHLKRGAPSPADARAKPAASDGDRQVGSNRPVSPTVGSQASVVQNPLRFEGASVEYVFEGKTFTIEGNPKNHRVTAAMEEDPYVIRSARDAREADAWARQSGVYRIVSFQEEPGKHYYLTREQFDQPSVRELLRLGRLIDFTAEK